MAKTVAHVALAAAESGHMPSKPTSDPIRRTSRFARNSSDACHDLILLGLTLAVYWPALNGDFLWSDDAHVTEMALRSFDRLRRIWAELGATQQYCPLLHSAFWLEARLWGDVVLGYHIANVVLHVIAAWLVVTLC